MKPVLVLEHQTPEKLAYLGTWLNRHNIPYQVYNAEIQKEFPAAINSYSALAVMGGAMSANDALYTNRQAEVLILQAMYKDIPVIGHCLGGQLMARALGAKINKSPAPEIGWQRINYADNALSKEWFGENPTSKVIHWHYESFDIPNDAVLVASSEACPNQAFAIGQHLAMQFHIEIDETKIHWWVNDDDEKWQSSRQQYQSVQSKDEILAEVRNNIAIHQATADHIYANWLKNTEYGYIFENR